MAALAQQGIQTSIHYPPIHHFKNYEGESQFLRTDLTVTEEVCRREVTLPLYPLMKDEDVRTVVESIQKSLRGLK